MPDSTPASSPDTAFLARVRQVVLQRYPSFDAFETDKKLPQGFVEHEWLGGELPRDMIAEQVVRALQCNREWLLTGEGMAFYRKAPQVPDEPEEIPSSAHPVDTSAVRASQSGLRPPSRLSRKTPPPADKAQPVQPATSPQGPPPPAAPSAASPGDGDAFNVRIAASGEPSQFDDRTPPRPHNPPKLAQHAADAFDEFNVVVGSGVPDAQDAPTERTSRVNIPRPSVAMAEEGASSTTGVDDGPSSINTDSVVIESVETDGDADRAKAQAIQRQKNLLRKAPDLPAMEVAVAFRPVKGVASEFYDFIPFGTERVAIVVGDVAGDEGLETWGDTAMAMRSIRIFAKETHSPRDILIKTNDELVPDLMAEASLTVVFSRLDIQSRLLTTAQSGHQPVLLYNPKRQSEPRQIKPSGMVLGLVSGPKFDQLLEEDTTTLREGDLLLWYTEGVPNTQNNRGQEFGIDSLAILMQSQGHRSADSFVHFLMRRIDTWRGDQAQVADQTVVALKVAGPLPTN